MLTTVGGWIRRDGRVDLEEGKAPSRDIPVLVTLLEDNFEAESSQLSDTGDYAETLADYEDRLARGQVRWK